MLLYCPPTTHLSDICKSVEHFIEEQSRSDIIIGGDLNIDLKKPPNKVTKFLNDQGLEQITTSPTHQSGSHIDHVWTNVRDPQPNVIDLWTYYSDHKQILVDITQKRQS